MALDWTSFAADAGHHRAVDGTGHGRATPLLWKTVASSTLKGNQRRYEYELLDRLREVMPSGVKVTVLADRGFADCKLFYALAGLRADPVAGRRLCDERASDDWRPRGSAPTCAAALDGRARILVCVHDRKMENPGAWWPAM